VIAVAASLPQMAWAQQSGLFPLHPIKRHRVPCDQEDPIYKINKYQYFGYHPTCWHTFPGGWGCPSDEAPNREKSFKETPLGSAAEGELPRQGPEQGPDMEAPPARPRTVPALPGEVDPFSQPSRPAPGRPQPGGATPPGPVEDPFTAPDVRPRDNRPGQAAPANPPRGNSPDLSAPADQPDPNGAPPRASHEGRDGPNANDGDDDGPILALPDIKLPPLADTGSVYEPSPTQVANSGNARSPANPNATQRRGLIGGLLSNLGVNWTRR
jgi:hypothetical protein